MQLSIFLLGVGCLLEGFKAPIPHHNLGSQEFNSDAESHFQRCYICIILHLRILVAQINQISLCLCTNKNQLPFPRPPSSSYNHSFSSGSFSNLPTLHLMLRNDLGSVAISLHPGLCASLENKAQLWVVQKGTSLSLRRQIQILFLYHQKPSDQCFLPGQLQQLLNLSPCTISHLQCFFPYNGQTNNSKQFAF